MPAVVLRSSIRVPSDMVVTARTLASLATKFSSADLTALVDLLIVHLDGREVDADLEPDPELCAA